jgi:hypothetical protein
MTKLLITQQPPKIEKNKHRFGLLRFLEILGFLTKFENYQILFNEISHRFLVTAKAIKWVKEPQFRFSNALR